MKFAVFAAVLTATVQAVSFHELSDGATFTTDGKNLPVLKLDYAAYRATGYNKRTDVSLSNKDDHFTFETLG
jgi:hypothetical protein